MAKKSVYRLVLRYGDWVAQERPAWAFDDNGKPRDYVQNQHLVCCVHEHETRQAAELCRASFYNHDLEMFHHGVVEELLV